MFVLQTTENSEKRVVEIKQTKLNSDYKQINTSKCWKPWQEGSESNAANYFSWVGNYIFWKSSSQNAHPLRWCPCPCPSAKNKILLIIYEAAAAHCLWRDNAGGRVSAVCIVRSLFLQSHHKFRLWLICLVCAVSKLVKEGLNHIYNFDNLRLSHNLQYCIFTDLDLDQPLW